MTLPVAFDILLSGVRLSLICAVIGLGCAFLLIAVILRSSAGNERMRQISGAIQEGAKAYLNRQVMTISMIAVVIFLLLFFFKDHPTAFGFLLGAFCSQYGGTRHGCAQSDRIGIGREFDQRVRPTWWGDLHQGR